VSQTQGQWVIASIHSGEIAPETARYASMDQAGQVLRELVQQGRLEEGSWEIRPAPTDGDVAPALTPDDF
jgi:hypothetical protein